MSDQQFVVTIDTPRSNLASIRATSVNKNKTSCHACKISYPANDLFFCTNLYKRAPIHPTKQLLCVTRCRKKFCLRCIRLKHASFETLPKSTWYCPACENQCNCMGCFKVRGTLVDIPAPKIQKLKKKNAPTVPVAQEIVLSPAKHDTSSVQQPTPADPAPSCDVVPAIHCSPFTGIPLFVQNAIDYVQRIREDQERDMQRKKRRRNDTHTSATTATSDDNNLVLDVNRASFEATADDFAAMYELFSPRVN